MCKSMELLVIFKSSTLNPHVHQDNLQFEPLFSPVLGPEKDVKILRSPARDREQLWNVRWNWWNYSLEHRRWGRRSHPWLKEPQMTNRTWKWGFKLQMLFLFQGFSNSQVPAVNFWGCTSWSLWTYQIYMEEINLNWGILMTKLL